MESLFFTFKSYRFINIFSKRKNIALSASFGVSRLENQYYEKCKNNFKNFKAISVREDQAQNILKDMGIYDSQVLIDPTMMLTSNEWEKLESKPSYVKKTILLLLLREYVKRAKVIN